LRQSTTTPTRSSTTRIRTAGVQIYHLWREHQWGRRHRRWVGSSFSVCIAVAVLVSEMKFQLQKCVFFIYYVHIFKGFYGALYFMTR
jgi:hypothetical protein